MRLSEEGIFIIENCIPPSMQDEIENYYFSEKYQWFEKTGKAQDVFSGKKLTTDLSRIKFEDGPIVNHFEFNLFLPVLRNAFKEIEVDFTPEDVILGRVLMQEPKGKNIRNNIHVDTDKKCYTLLYYVNDSDGDTIFFNTTTKKYSHSEYEKERFLPDWIEKQGRIFTEVAFQKTPKKGTAVIFDGSIYHASSTPTKNRRCIINFCYNWK